MKKIYIIYSYLAFEPPAPTGFQSIKKKSIKSIISTWIEGPTTGTRTVPARFLLSSWNAYDRSISKLNRTNNFLESWNKQFAATVGHSKPTLWNFLAAMYLEQSSTDEKILKASCGDAPEARKKKNIIKDMMILHTVEDYDPVTMDLVVYLDSLRNVM